MQPKEPPSPRRSPGRWAGSPPAATTRPWRASSRSCRTTFSTAVSGPPKTATDRDRDLDRTDLPPPAPTSRPRPLDPRRARDHHETPPGPRGLNPPVTKTCSSPYRCGQVIVTTGLAGHLREVAVARFVEFVGVSRSRRCTPRPHSPIGWPCGSSRAPTGGKGAPDGTVTRRHRVILVQLAFPKLMRLGLPKSSIDDGPPAATGAKSPADPEATRAERY